MNTTVLFFAYAIGFLALVALGVIIPTVWTEIRKSKKLDEQFLNDLYYPNQD